MVTIVILRLPVEADQQEGQDDAGDGEEQEPTHGEPKTILKYNEK